jgi:hypothetical protein
MKYSDINTVLWICGSISVFIATLSLIGTTITLSLIHYMGKWNGYLKLIIAMTIAQMFHDSLFFFLPCYEDDSCSVIIKFLEVFGGCAVSLYINIISIIVVYIVLYLSSFPFKSYEHIFLIFIPLISLVFGILTVSVRHNTEDYFFIVYDWFRIGSILLNIILYGVTYHKLSRMGYISLCHLSENAAEDPVYVLISRLKYYPVCQVLCFSGAAWYQLQYGREETYEDAKGSIPQTISLILFSLSNPAAGFCNFVVFLVCQPAAYMCLKQIYKKYGSFICCALCNRSSDDSDNDLDAPFLFSNYRDSKLSRNSNSEINEADRQSMYISYYTMDEDQLGSEISKLNDLVSVIGKQTGDGSLQWSIADSFSSDSRTNDAQSIKNVLLNSPYLS